MTAPDDFPESVLIPGALFWSDGQRLICATCAGLSALTSGRDLSGQKVRRVTLGDFQIWLAANDAMSCELGCTTLTDREGPDGWPEASSPGIDEESR